MRKRKFGNNLQFLSSGREEDMTNYYQRKSRKRKLQEMQERLSKKASVVQNKTIQHPPAAQIPDRLPKINLVSKSQ